MKYIKLLICLQLLLSFSLMADEKVNIGYIFPSGGQKGSNFEIVVGGQNLKEIVGIYVSGNGISGELIELIINEKAGKYKKQKNDQIAELLRIQINIDKNAESGLRDFRLVTKTGSLLV